MDGWSRIHGGWVPGDAGLPTNRTADTRARIETMTTASITDTVQIKRMTEFASDVTRLADQRPDLDLRRLVDDLHADLLKLKEDDDG